MRIKLVLILLTAYYAELQAAFYTELQGAYEKHIVEAKRAINNRTHCINVEAERTLRSNKPSYYIEMTKQFEQAFIEMHKSNCTAIQYDTLNAQRWAAYNEAECKLKAEIKALADSTIKDDSIINNAKTMIHNASRNLAHIDNFNMKLNNAYNYSLPQRAIKHMSLKIVMHYDKALKSSKKYVYRSDNIRVSNKAIHIYVSTLNFTHDYIMECEAEVEKALSNTYYDVVILVKGVELKVPEDKTIKEYLTYTLVDIEAVKLWQDKAHKQHKDKLAAKAAGKEFSPEEIWDFNVPKSIYCGKKTASRQVYAANTQPFTWLSALYAGVEKVNGIPIKKWIESKKIVWTYPKKVLLPLVNKLKYGFASLAWHSSDYADGEGQGSYYYWVGSGCNLYSKSPQPGLPIKYTPMYYKEHGVVPTVVYAPSHKEHQDIKYILVHAKFFDNPIGVYKLYYREGTDEDGNPANYFIAFIKQSKKAIPNADYDDRLNHGHYKYMPKKVAEEARLYRSIATILDPEGGILASEAKKIASTCDIKEVLYQAIDNSYIVYQQAHKYNAALKLLIKRGLINIHELLCSVDTLRSYIKFVGNNYWILPAYNPTGSGAWSELFVFDTWTKTYSIRYPHSDYINNNGDDVRDYEDDMDDPKEVNPIANASVNRYADELADDSQFSAVEKYVIEKNKNKMEEN